MLTRSSWADVELLVYRENIHRPTVWSIDAPRHTVIVHLSGAMRSLETEIDGSGACHVPPAPGDIWLVPAQHRYASRAIGNVITYAELRVLPDAEVELAPGRNAPIDELRPRLAHRDEFLYQAVVHLHRLALNGDDLTTMMAERLQSLLRQHLFRDYRCERSAAARRNPLRFSAGDARRISDYVEENLAERITLADLAAIARLNVHQLLIAFHQSFQTTPAQYVLTQRLIRARWLLINSHHDIASIALATGFSSHSHFTAHFRSRLGITPRAFRETHRASISGHALS